MAVGDVAITVCGPIPVATKLALPCRSAVETVLPYDTDAPAAAVATPVWRS